MLSLFDETLCIIGSNIRDECTCQDVLAIYKWQEISKDIKKISTIKETFFLEWVNSSSGSPTCYVVKTSSMEGTHEELETNDGVDDDDEQY